MQFNPQEGPFTGMASVTASSEFPRILTYQDAAGVIWDTGPDEYMLGVNGRGETETFDLVADSPHMFVSAESGAGKSVVAASIATQSLVKGGSAVFLDVKRISHRWAKNLPGVTYAVEVDEIANVIVSVAAELRRRMRVIENYPGKISDAPVGPRIVLVAEEINSMMSELEEFERSLPPRGVYRPRRAFRDILNLGRAAKVHVVAFAQYPDTKLIPRPVIEAFGTRILIRHTRESWNSLAWSLGYAPPAPQARGRGLIIRAGKAIETQFLYLTEEECAHLVRTLRPEAERVGLIQEARRALAQRRELRALERGERG
ncbi:hypothetical protein [Streptomyces roseolus]|uniref:hypothetical protein n=1 Tax=Streptomyces roseolus TaxID=67358 RepID=UPI001672B9AA|nr:hypothetical protein [Streptomyces roseolus]GGR51863.1 hypothetical protein GCM10010282_51000 [Streptomyces roseolus]